MPKTKETKVALKGENPKKAPKISETARKAPPHTEEIKNESDSEGSTSDSSSGHSSGSESDAERRKNTKKPSLKKTKETEPNSPPVADDSSDDASDSEDNKAPAAVDTNGTAHKTEGSSGEASSESESDNESGSEEQEEAAEPQRRPGQAAASETTATAIIPPQPFVPPPGYKPVNTKARNGSTLSSLFDPESLASKQVWHITAPSSVPLSDIKSVSLFAIQTHQIVLSHKGSDYNLVEETSRNSSLMVPSSKADGYAAVEVPVAKTLNLQQTVRLPNVPSQQTNPVTGSNAAAKIDTPPVRGPRPQPKNLKMRYKPPGFGDGDPGTIGSSDSEGESDVDMTDAPAAGFRQPTTASKRKRDEKEATEASPRKDKKRRKAEALAKEAKKAEERLVEGTSAEAPETAEEKERKKREKKEKKRKDKSK